MHHLIHRAALVIPRPPRRAIRAATTSLALALLVGACGDDAPTSSAAPAASAARSAAATLPEAHGQTDDVLALVAAFDAAWDARDAAAYGALYAADAVFISPLGIVLEGRAAIQGQHAFLFANPFRGVVHESQVRRVTFLTGTIAVVDLDVRLTGFVRLPPGLAATEPGVLRSRERLIVAKRGGEWQILMNQVTAVAPAP